MTHFGRDYSSYQGNLTEDDCAGIDFAFVKLTEGGEYKNPYAIQQVGMLRSQGVLVGYYHFLTQTDLIGDQLHNFSTFASALGVTTLPLALDSETADPAGWPDLASKMMDFATGVESWTNWVPNTKSILYVNLNFYDNLQGFPWGRWVWLADPNPGAPHKPCLILQGAPRPVSATDAKVIDVDTFMGTDTDWEDFTQGAVQVKSAPPVTISTPPPVAPVVAVPTAPPFPLPAGNWFGPPSVDPDNHSGFYSQADRNMLEVWQRRMQQRGWKITVDGEFGPQMHQIVTEFQKEKGLKVDGLLGPATWAAAWTTPVTP